MNYVWALLHLLAAALCGILACVGYFFTAMSLTAPRRSVWIAFGVFALLTLGVAGAALYFLGVAFELAFWPQQ